jgi:hypothetical protein
MTFRFSNGKRKRSTGYRRDRSGGVSLYRGAAIAPFFRAMAQRRVDWFELSDSNEVFGGTGRNHGIQHGFFTNRIPLYGPGIFSGNENLGVGSAIGYFAQHQANGARTNDNASLPAPLAAYYALSVPVATGGQFQTHYPWYQSDAQSDASNNGIAINFGSVWDTSAAWTGRYIYARLTAAEGAGQIQPNIRLGYAPFTILANGGVITTGSAIDYGLTQLTLQAAAGTRTGDIQFRWHNANQQGPVYNLYQTATQDDRTTGVQVHTMVYRGGQGALEYAQALQANATAAPLFISFAVNGQASGSETALFCINCGLNDRNDDGQLSIGPVGGLDSATPEGYADNVRAILNEIEAAWVGNGYARERLFFLLQPSHPISVPDDSELVGYREAMKAVADEYVNTAMQNLNHPIFANALAANATTWYNTGGADRLHMTQTGYEQFYTLVIRDLIS